MNDRGAESIFAKMHAIMTEIGAIGKDGTNDFQKYKFRGISQVVDALQPMLVKHGVIMIPQYSGLQLHTQDKGYTATCNLQLGFISVEDGTNMFFASVGQGADSGDKAANKAMTAAFKYALCHGLAIRESEVGEDADSDSPSVTRKGAKPPIADPTIPKPVKPTVRNLLEG